MRRTVRSLTVLAATVLLTACGSAAEPPVDGTPGPVRDHWQLSHRVRESAGMQVVGHQLGHYEESTEVSFGPDQDGQDVRCFVSVSAAGQGGPENKVGERLATAVQGRPAVRNGAGAEGDYLMWQREDGRWVESSCLDEGQRAYQDRLAELVRTAPASVRLPFDVDTLPAGYSVSEIRTDLVAGAVQVYLGDDSDVLLSYDDENTEPSGRPTVVAGRDVLLGEDPRWPGLCLVEQGHDVCVDVAPGDTGPYPDRTSEIPALADIAGGLRFRATLSDRSSWFRAEDVFG